MYGTIYLHFLCIACLFLVSGLLSALFPVRMIRMGQWFWALCCLRLGKKAPKPLRRWRIVLERAAGCLFIVIGMAVIHSLPMEISLIRDGLSTDSALQSVSRQDSTNGVRAFVVAEVEKQIRSLLANTRGIGMTVGVLYGDEQLILGYGAVRSGTRQAPDGDTIYEIGSMTKVFTALLLAELSDEGRVALTDPVAKFMPSSVSVPRYNDTEITLGDLVSHLSGLPRVPDNLYDIRDWLSLSVLRNPYRSYTPRRLYDFLSRCRLQSNAGTKFEYSNLGMGLLGYALAQSQGMSYEELVETRICNPLSMGDTRVVLNAEQHARAAQGYAGPKRLGRVLVLFPQENWDIPVLEGAGALKSSVKDLMKFMSANIVTSRTTLGPAMEKTHQERHQCGIPQWSVAMGWLITNLKDVNVPMLWHNGGTGGYHSFMGFNKKQNIGIVILCNSETNGDVVDIAGVRILKALISRSAGLPKT